MVVTVQPVKGVRAERRWHLLLGAVCALASSVSGCTWDRWNLFTPPPAPPGPADSLVLRGDKLEPETLPKDIKGAPELAGAHEFYRRGEYVKAEKLFRSIADNTHNSPQVAEEARYYEAESLRWQKCYPKACDVYNQMLKDFPSGVHREQAVERIYEIANVWLEDTREDMRRDKEKRDGQHWFVMPTSFVHTEKTKPLLDEEGRAIEALDEVVLNDFNGKRADEALFMAGSVKFFREDYKEADRYFSQIVEMHPNSRFAQQAIELAIISKHLSTGGSDYDGRKVAEARKLVDTALRNYPELAAQKSDFLDRQLRGITMQQAEKDFKVAEFYRHTGHPGSAYFYYEIVRRRYPGTPFAERAIQRMNELRSKLEKSQAQAAPAGQAAPVTPSQLQALPQGHEAPDPVEALPVTLPVPGPGMR
jgi:outer membrane protein assembly factor BamD (BamD/ComL family)